MTEYLSVDTRSARLCMLQAFQHQDCGAFRKDETLAFGIEGARGSFRIVIVVDRQGAHSAETADGKVHDQRLDAAGDDQVCGAAPDHFTGFADSLGASGAGR